MTKPIFSREKMQFFNAFVLHLLISVTYFLITALFHWNNLKKFFLSSSDFFNFRSNFDNYNNVLWCFPNIRLLRCSSPILLVFFLPVSFHCYLLSYWNILFCYLLFYVYLFFYHVNYSPYYSGWPCSLFFSLFSYSDSFKQM